MRRLRGKTWFWVLATLVLLAWLSWPRPVALPAPDAPSDIAAEAGVGAPDRTPSATRPARLPAFLPAEAHPVVERILSGAPHPYPQDGATFSNREGRLPERPRGHYREYTVPTPGVGHRGALRIVTGGAPPSEWYYTDDHYDSFRRFEVAR